MVTTVYKQARTIPAVEAGKRDSKRMNMPDWTPMDGVAVRTPSETKTSGIQTRGNGAATKGRMARGPMA
jgi:hypothetical protein